MDTFDSENFFDIWAADWHDFINNSESIDELTDKQTALSPQLPQLSHLPLQTLSVVPSNSAKDHSINSSAPTNFANSNEKLCEIKEFSDAIDSYFSSCYPNNNTNGEETQPVNSFNSIQSSSTSLTCYNSSSDSALDSSTSSNSLSPINTIDCLNLYQNAPIKPPGYRKISLTKDCSKVEEPWIPSVAKKLLASYYSPLSMKSELFSNQVMLDAYETVALQEAVEAFNDIAFVNPYCDSELVLAIQYDFYSDPRPIELIYSCEKVKAYRKLNTEDKINLMTRAFFDINNIKGIINYDETIDGWMVAGQIWPRTAIQWDSPHLLKLQDMIETYPDCLRSDINVIALIFLIIIFNPDLPKLKFRNGIRQEQYIYIHLLKRYLVSLFGSNCEASDYHYRLMVKIEQTITIPENVCFEQIQPGSTKVLKSRVVKLVQHKSITLANTD